MPRSFCLLASSFALCLCLSSQYGYAQGEPKGWSCQYRILEGPRLTPRVYNCYGRSLSSGIVTFTRVLRENARRRHVSRGSSHGIPPIHRFSSELSHCSARDQMALNVEGVIDRCMCGEQSLRRTGGLKALHPSFSLPYREMRILDPIVDPTAGYVASSHPKFAQCRAI